MKLETIGQENSLRSIRTLQYRLGQDIILHNYVGEGRISTETRPKGIHSLRTETRTGYRTTVTGTIETGLGQVVNIITNRD